MNFLRPPRHSDQAYLASTWLHSLARIANRPLGRDGGHLARQIDAVFDRPDTRALIRHANGDPDRILGWVVYVHGPGVPVAHYVYVRKDYREKGIATQLLDAIGAKRDAAVVYTCDVHSVGRKLVSAYPLATHLPLAEFLKPT